jgi:hypothetical protein
VNWDAVAAIAEFVGSIAVVASLGYLAVQIRRGSRDSQRSVYFSLRSQVQEFRAMLAREPELARVYRQGLVNLGQLDDDDRWRFGALMQYEFSFFEDFFHLAREVTVLQSVTEDLRWFASRPGARAWWSKGRRLYHPDFQRHVDALVSQQEAVSGTSASPPAAQQGAAADEPQRVPIGLW